MSIFTVSQSVSQCVCGQTASSKQGMSNSLSARRGITAKIPGTDSESHLVRSVVSLQCIHLTAQLDSTMSCLSSDEDYCWHKMTNDLQLDGYRLTSQLIDLRQKVCFAFIGVRPYLLCVAGYMRTLVHVTHGASQPLVRQSLNHSELNINSMLSVLKFHTELRTSAKRGHLPLQDQSSKVV